MVDSVTISAAGKSVTLTRDTETSGDRSELGHMTPRRLGDPARTALLHDEAPAPGPGRGAGPGPGPGASAGAGADQTRTIRPPSDSRFDHEEVDYLPAPEIAAIADRLLDEKPQLREVQGYEFAIWWKRKGGQAGGKRVLGKCAKTPPLAKALKPSTWTIWLAADHCRDFALTDLQLEALVFHELLHAELRAVEVRDAMSGASDVEYRPAVGGHDVECFWAEIQEYGLWTSELRRSKDIFEQASLPGIDQSVSYGGRA